MTRIATILLVITMLMLSSLAAIAHPNDRSKIKRRGLPARVAALAERVENLNQHDLSLFEATLSQVEQSAQIIKQLCDQGVRLTLCPSAEVKRVFVTSTQHRGNIPGTSAADLFCNIRAQAGGHSGYFKAWISDSPETDPESTFTRSSIPYALPDGSVVAADWTDLTDGQLNVPIDQDENGQTVVSNAPFDFNVWTGTDHRGQHYFLPPPNETVALDCDNWFATDAQTVVNENGVPWGIGGFTSHTNSSWSLQSLDNFELFSPTTACAQKHNLYCFEQ